MFLVESLNDKLKRTMYEMDPEKNQTCLFPYKKPEKNGAVITVHKHDPSTEFDSQKLNSLSTKEWEKTFTLPKLRKKWKEKITVNFNPNYKKIADEVMPEKAREAKAYVNDLIDQDTLEVKPKRWNASVNPKMSNYRDVHKTIFQVSQGLNAFNVVPLKEHRVPEGVTSRNYMYIDGEKWNNSTLFEDFEKKDLHKANGEAAKENSLRYWRRTEYDRFNEEMLPISKEKLNIEQSRYYHRYLNPTDEFKYHYKTMGRVKDLTWIERDKKTKEIISKIPKTLRFPEKIKGLVDKAMQNTYEEKYNEITGKAKSRSNTTESNKKEWKDDELAFKVKTLSEWNDTNWFKPIRTEASLSPNKQKRKEYFTRELLKPLVSKGTKILKEEEAIKHKLEEEHKMKLKKDSLRMKSYLATSKPKEETPEEKIYKELSNSKYPLNKESYEKHLKTIPNEDMKTHCNTETNFNDTSLVLHGENNIVPSSQPVIKKYFLEAYKSVASEDMKEKKERYKKRGNYDYQCMHFGTYRDFEFKNKEYTDPDIGTYKVSNEKFKAWSCCMNTDENSKGCRKIKINKFKWNYDNA